MKSNDKLNKVCNGNVRRLRFIKIRLKKRYNHKQNYIILNQILRGAWRIGLHVWLVMWRWLVRAPSNAPVVSLSKKFYPCCLVMVGSRISQLN